MLAKLIDGQLVVAPKKLRIGQTVVYNPTEDMLLAAGYLVVEETPEPPVEYGYYSEAYYEEEADKIVQKWRIVKEPDDEEIEESEALSIILGLS